MNPKRPSATLILGTLVLLVGFLAGCGGGDQSGNGSQEGGPGEAKKQGVGEDTQPGSSETKIVLGTVTSVDTEARKIILRPSTEVQGEKPQRFKIGENATITLDDEQAELTDVKAGQEAQITYIVRKERNIARVVALISRGS
jgi:hypothetical protein